MGNAKNKERVDKGEGIVIRAKADNIKCSIKIHLHIDGKQFICHMIAV